MGQALERKFKMTGDQRYYVDPNVAMLPIDALGFRRGAGALKTLLPSWDWQITLCSPRPRRAVSALWPAMPNRQILPMT